MTNEEILKKWEKSLGLLETVKKHDKMDIALFLEELCQYIIENGDDVAVPEDYPKDFLNINVIMIPMAIRIYSLTGYRYGNPSDFIENMIKYTKLSYKILNEYKKVDKNIDIEAECTALAADEMIIDLLEENKIRVIKE